MKKTILRAEKECPLIREVDVVICGGGPGGIGAAVAAARLGMKTVIIERFGALGGLTTTGLVTTCMSGVALSGDKILIKGVFEQIVDKAVAKGGAIRGYELKYSNKFFMYDTSRCEKDQQVTPFDPEVYKACAEELMEENDIEVMYYSLITDVIMDGNVMKGIMIDNKSGTQAIIAKQVIDATGDASVSRMAGAECVMDKGEKTSMTLMFHFGGARDVAPSYKPDVTEVPYGAVNFFPMMRAGEYRAEMTRYIGDTINAEDLTKATLTCRKQIPQVLDYLKKNVAGCENVYLINSASVIGTLATPRIVGEQVLTEDYIMDLKIPEDRIALTAYGIDVHSDEEGGQNELHWLDPGQYYGIPYGVIIPKTKIENLVAAGRVASADYRSATALACSAICMAVGEAAGTAAALSIQNNTTPRGINVKLVQETLVANGAILEAEQIPDSDRDWTYRKSKS